MVGIRRNFLKKFKQHSSSIKFKNGMIKKSEVELRIFMLINKI